MAKTLTISRILMQIVGDYARTSDHQTANTNFTFSYSDTLASGTAEDQADLLWDDERVLGIGADDDIDLGGGFCTDIYTDDLIFVEIRAFAIHNLSTTSGDILEVGASGGFEWVAWVGAVGDKVKVYPKGLLFLTAPGDGDLPVVAGATDLLRIHNASAANAVSYKVYIWGTSA